MKYSKIFQYAYLIFAVIFTYDVVKKYMDTGEINYPYLLLAALAVFMFFFRRKFNKKLDNKDNSN